MSAMGNGANGAEALPERTFAMVVGALGGEGGGVLTSWIVAAAESLGYPVQSTSIPGVAQRTGATTYYIEFYPAHRDRLEGRAPTMARRYSRLPATGTTRSSRASPVTTCVGAATRRQSAAKSTPSTMRTRSAMRTATNGCSVTRRRCCQPNASRAPRAGMATAISG